MSSTCLTSRGRWLAGAAGCHWHRWAAERCVGWLEVPKGSLNHLRVLTPAAGSQSACQGWALEGGSGAEVLALRLDVAREAAVWK
jgi:hypothetical protein